MLKLINEDFYSAVNEELLKISAAFDFMIIFSMG
jgi:hypothetical protein